MRGIYASMRAFDNRLHEGVIRCHNNPRFVEGQRWRTDYSDGDEGREYDREIRTPGGTC